MSKAPSSCELSDSSSNKRGRSIDDLFQEMNLSNPNTKVAREYFEALVEKNHLKLYSLVSSQAQFRFPDTGVTMPMNAFIHSILSVHDAFPDLMFTCKSIVKTSDGVFIRTDA